jgi:carnitine O-acetyltransferase
MPTSTTQVRRFAMPKSLDAELSLPGQPQTATDEGRSLEGAKAAKEEFTKEQKDPFQSNRTHLKQGITFAAQDKLPKLPIPDLEHSMEKYLIALKPLQGAREHSESKQAVEEFLKGEGPELQERLKKYANGKTSYIEQFCECFQSFLIIVTNNARVRLVSQL